MIGSPDSVYILGSMVQYEQVAQYDNMFGRITPDSLTKVGIANKLTPEQKNTFFHGFKVVSVHRTLEDAQAPTIDLVAKFKLKHKGSLEEEWKAKGKPDAEGLTLVTRRVTTFPIYRVSYEKGKVTMFGLQELKLHRIQEIWVTNHEGSIIVEATDHPGLNGKSVSVDKDFLD